MRSALLLVLALAGMPSHAQDKWIAPDKAKHFAGSVVLGIVADGVLRDRAPAWVRFSVALAPGLVKEMTDSRFSAKDLAWDAAGVYVGMKASGWMIRRNSITYSTEF